MSKTLALVGNPNSGKTTLFNNLTGSKQYVGNWPGVTVERKGGKLKKHDGFEVMDLPGIYSLSPYSPEEVITRNYLLEENPDVIVNIVDGSNLERNLYLTMQLLEMGCKVVVALNMMDLVRANGDVLDTELLSKELGCPVVPITAVKVWNSSWQGRCRLLKHNVTEKTPTAFQKKLNAYCRKLAKW